MKEEIFHLLWQKFLEKEYKSILKRKRNYLHFDRAIRFSKQQLNSFNDFKIAFDKRFLLDFKSGNFIINGFYPFIETAISVPRYKYIEELGRRSLTFKKRPICYAAHFDALRYSWYATILDYCYELVLKDEKINSSILAYRRLPEKFNNIDFAFTVFKEIETRGECVVLAFDISKFFEKINHLILKKKWIEVLNRIDSELKDLPNDHFKVYKSLTKFRYVIKNNLQFLDGDSKFTGIKSNRITTPINFRDLIRNFGLIQLNPYFKLKAGIPQGSPISAVLANISMLDFDRELNDFIDTIDGKYYRYSDDLIIICHLSDELKVLEKANELINNFHLKFNDKTETIRFHIVDGKLTSKNSKGNNQKLQYLGFEFDGQRIYIRSSSISRYHRKLNKAVSRALSMTFGKYSLGDRVRKTKLLKRYTQSGKSNFITYARRAGETGYNCGSIQKQYTLKQYKNINKLIQRKLKH